MIQVQIKTHIKYVILVLYRVYVYMVVVSDWGYVWEKEWQLQQLK